MQMMASYRALRFCSSLFALFARFGEFNRQFLLIFFLASTRLIFLSKYLARENPSVKKLAKILAAL